MAWIPIVASVAGSLISSMGQRDTNNTNQQIQENNSAFNAEQAQLNRDFNQTEALRARAFSEQMSNTVWQRGVNDMQAAGLNPMLAYSQGGNPAPQGAQATGSAASAGNPGNMQNAFASAGHSAQQWAQIENIQAQTEKTRVETENAKAQTIERDEEGNLKPKTYETREQAKRGDLLHYDAKKRIEEVIKTSREADLVLKQVDEVIARTQNLDQNTRVQKINEVLLRHDIPRMKAESEYFGTEAGKASPHNKYGPQTPFRLIENLGERVINNSSALDGAMRPKGWPKWEREKGAW